MEKIRPKKGLGQNFLTDINIVNRIVDAAEVSERDHILEIGPGRGIMTRAIAARGATLIALELDRQLIPLLQEDFGQANNVQIIHGDILKTDLRKELLTRFDGEWKVVANLPYNISSQVLIKFLDDRRLFSRMVLMLQREVGERLIASPGCKEYGILTVFCRLHFDILKEFVVRPGSFYPAPKVDSVVLSFAPLAVPRTDVGDEAFFREVVRSSFSQRRKTLWNCLRSSFLLSDGGILHEVLSEVGIDGGRRGETLSLEEFASLTIALLNAKIKKKTPLI